MPVALVPDGAAHSVLHTLLADHIVPEKRSRRTEHAEIMQRLHHRHLAAECRVKDGRADHRQRVVYMHDVDLVLPDQLFYLAVSLKREHRGKRQEQLSHNALLHQLAVGAVVRVDLVSVFLEQALFIAHHHIFPARDLIKIVYL